MPLFKYVTPARLDILRHGRIRFTPAVALNDPFELRPYFDTLAPEDELIRRARENPVDLLPYLREAYETFEPEFKAKVSLDAFADLVQALLAAPEAAELHRQGEADALAFLRSTIPVVRKSMWDLLTSRIGILSLTATATNQLMWAHYAAEHAGLVLEFNPEDSFFQRSRSASDEFYRLRQVAYRARVPEISLEELAEQTDVLVSKLPQWAYEEESRLLAPLDQAASVLHTAQGPVHLFPIPPTAIVGLILGARATPSLLEEAEAAILRSPGLSHVGIANATLDDATGAIEVGLYRYPARSGV